MIVYEDATVRREALSSSLRRNVKKNIEIRFFLTPDNARKLLAKWRSEKWEFIPYSFTDYYYTKGRSQAKIRDWKSVHTPRIETIFFERKNGVKTETWKAASTVSAASEELKLTGFKPYMRIVKEKAWLVSKKGMLTYAFEFVPGLGWTGEIEFPEKDKGKIPNYVSELKRTGAFGFSKRSLLQLMKRTLFAPQGRSRSAASGNHVKTAIVAGATGKDQTSYHRSE